MDASIELPDPGAELRAIYDESLPHVYGYLARRCGSPLVAEDLTAETYLAAVSSIGRGAVDRVTVAWLVGIARHKLVDHWRADARRTRHLELVGATEALLTRAKAAFRHSYESITEGGEDQ